MHDSCSPSGSGLRANSSTTSCWDTLYTLPGGCSYKRRSYLCLRFIDRAANKVSVVSAIDDSRGHVDNIVVSVLQRNVSGFVDSFGIVVIV